MQKRIKILPSKLMVKARFSLLLFFSPTEKKIIPFKSDLHLLSPACDSYPERNSSSKDHNNTMLYRVQRIEEFVKQLKAGDIKLGVRVLEVFYPFSSF